MQTAKLIVLIMILLVFIYIAREVRKQRLSITFVGPQVGMNGNTVVQKTNPESSGMSGYARGMAGEISASAMSFFGQPRETSYIG